MRRMIHRFDEEAKRKGIKIVHMAGFDSIPSDLGAFLLADHMRKQHKKWVHPALQPSCTNSFLNWAS